MQRFKCLIKKLDFKIKPILLNNLIHIKYNTANYADNRKYLRINNSIRTDFYLEVLPLSLTALFEKLFTVFNH